MRWVPHSLKYDVGVLGVVVCVCLHRFSVVGNSCISCNPEPCGLSYNDNQFVRLRTKKSITQIRRLYKISLGEHNYTNNKHLSCMMATPNGHNTNSNKTIPYKTPTPYDLFFGAFNSITSPFAKRLCSTKVRCKQPTTRFTTIFLPPENKYFSHAAMILVYQINRMLFASSIVDAHVDRRAAKRQITNHFLVGHLR